MQRVHVQDRQRESRPQATASAVERSLCRSRSTGEPSAASVTAPSTSARPAIPIRPQLTSVNAIAAMVRRAPPRTAARSGRGAPWPRARLVPGRGRRRRSHGQPERGDQPGAARRRQGPARVELPQLGVQEQLLGRGRKVVIFRECGPGHLLRHECAYSCRTRCPVGHTPSMDWSHYRFRSVWALPAPPSEVYPVLEQAEDYPRWWPQVREVTRIDERSGTMRIRSFLPVRPGVHGARTAPRPGGRGPGDRDGGRPRGLGALDAHHRRVRHPRPVRPGGRREPLLRRFAVPGRPVFRANHALMMRAGQRGLAARLTGD